MQAAARQVFGSGSLRGRRVGLIGVGRVGALLARMLVGQGAELSVTDLDPRCRDIAAAVGAHWVDTDELLTAEQDIVVPAAAGGLLTDAVAAALRCRLIVGPANNQLETDAVADRLHERGILWVPDIIAGAGGIVRAVAIEEQGRDEPQAAAMVDAIGDTVAVVLGEADRSGATPLAVARRVAAQRYDQARAGRSAVTTPGPGAEATVGTEDRCAAEAATRASYDRLATAYAERFGDELAGKPLDRALLRSLAEDAGIGARTLDLGCGPGHVTAHLAGLGLRPIGVDLSSGMIEVARARHPQLEFQRADILDLVDQLDAPADQEGFAAAVALYSLIHLDPRLLRRALRNVRTVLRVGAPFLLAFHRGDEVRHVDELWGTPVDLDFRFLRPDDVRSSLEQAGFRVTSVTERAPYPGVEAATQRVYFLARATSTA
jgi:SAM-dependent methyltransferase